MDDISWWAKISGIWMIAAGVSLLFVFFRQYRARARYLYVFFLGCWAGLWGLNRLRGEILTPGWMLWLIFVLGILAMLRDSVLRYRATSDELRAQRMERLKTAEPPPDADPKA